MTLVGIFSSLINLGGISSWTQHPIMSLFLTIDGLVYTLVSYAFKLFMLMCQVNYDSLYGVVSELLDRIQAVVMVLIVFKIGLELVKYLLDPDSAMKGGKKLLINIAISASFLLLYSFVFSVLNEIGILVMGNDINYSFPVLSRIADIEGGNDEGLIMRFMFGENATDVEDIGDFLAYSTVTIFIHDKSETSGNSEVRRIICSSGTCNFHDLPNIVPKLDKTIEYQWGISSLVGLFLVYSIVRNAIELGVRMFKLIILRMLAPLAIITIIKDGVKGKVFSSFVSTYISTFAQAFVRMLTMLLVTVFICKFYLSIGDFFGSNVTADMPRITRLLLTVMIVVAAYRMAGQIPSFLDGILGTHMAKDNTAGGFGHFVGGLVGVGAGALGGLATGVASGAGVTGALGNMVAGGYRGAQSGARANSVAEFFKNNGENSAASRQRARQMALAGGGLAYAGHAAENALGITARREAALNREQDRLTALQNVENLRNENMGKDGAGRDYGADREAYVKARGDEAEQTARQNAQKFRADQFRHLNEERQAAYAALQANGGNRSASYNGSTIQSVLDRISSDETALNDQIDSIATRARTSVESAADRNWTTARANTNNNLDVQNAQRSAMAVGTRRQRAAVRAGNEHGEIARQRDVVSRAQHSGSLERQNRQNVK